MGLGMCGGVVVIEGKGALCEVSDSAEGAVARKEDNSYVS